jgi:hypothetical protein
MRIVVSGTHASGKSTLISDFALGHPEFSVLADPFDLMDERWDRPGAAMFASQLRIAADRLSGDDLPDRVIAERGPLDFFAYLLALEHLGRASSSRELLERAAGLTAEALGHVDLIVVLPLGSADGVAPGADEDPELRDAMNDALLDLVTDPHLIGGAGVIEIVGDRQQRLSSLESRVSPRPR